MRRIVVVGAGIIGLCCAYELRRRGAMVTVLEQGKAGAGCSAGNSGWIVPSLSTPLPAPGLLGTSLSWMLKRDGPFSIRPRIDPALARWLWHFSRCCNERIYRAGVLAMTRLTRGTPASYDALQADGVEFEMHRAGLLFVFRTEAGLRGTVEDVAAMAARCGYRQPEVLTANEVRLLEPGVSESISGGLFLAEERHIRPETLTAGLVKRLRERGVEIQSGAGVTGLQKRGAHVTAVTTRAQVFEADQFLIAAGVWSDRLAKQVGCVLPLQAGAGYSVTVRNPLVTFRHSLYLFEAKLACSPFSSALRIAGTLDLCGLDAPVDRGRIASITRSADRYLNGWRGAQGETTWMGMRPLLPDGLPAIGRAPGADNVYVATGHAMLGMTLAPATALAVADAMCSGTDDPELAAFSPARFAA